LQKYCLPDSSIIDNFQRLSCDAVELVPTASVDDAMVTPGDYGSILDSLCWFSVAVLLRLLPTLRCDVSVLYWGPAGPLDPDKTDCWQICCDRGWVSLDRMSHGNLPVLQSLCLRGFRKQPLLFYRACLEPSLLAAWSPLTCECSPCPLSGVFSDRHGSEVAGLVLARWHEVLASVRSLLMGAVAPDLVDVVARYACCTPASLNTTRDTCANGAVS
jgi:hypothetical protein